jgi:hypothetical protein
MRPGLHADAGKHYVLRGGGVYGEAPLDGPDARFLVHPNVAVVNAANSPTHLSHFTPVPDERMLSTTSGMKTVGTVLACTGPILMVLPIALPLIFLPLGSLLGFKVYGESGMVDYRGKLLEKGDEQGALVHSFGEFLAAMGMMPWMLFYSIPVGFLLLIVGVILRSVAT